MAGKKQIGKGLAAALKLKKKRTGSQKGKPLLSGVTDQSRSDAMRGLAKRSAASTDALYSAQAKVRELAQKAGMRVAQYKQKNPNNTHVKTIDSILNRAKPKKKTTTTTTTKAPVAKKQTGLDKAKARLAAKKKTTTTTTKAPETKKKSTAPRAKAQAMLDEAKKSASYQKALKDKTVVTDLDKLSKSQFEKMLATDAGQKRLGTARMNRYFEKFDYYKEIDMNKVDSYADLKKSKKTYSRRKTKSKKKK